MMMDRGAHQVRWGSWSWGFSTWGAAETSEFCWACSDGESREAAPFAPPRELDKAVDEP